MRVRNKSEGIGYWWLMLLVVVILCALTGCSGTGSGVVVDTRKVNFDKNLLRKCDKWEYLTDTSDEAILKWQKGRAASYRDCAVRSDKKSALIQDLFPDPDPDTKKP